MDRVPLSHVTTTSGLAGTSNVGHPSMERNEKCESQIGVEGYLTSSSTHGSVTPVAGVGLKAVLIIDRAPSKR